MRKLYLVPVIHMSADMGSVAAALVEGSSSHLGQELWHKHEETVLQFWDSIAHFFDSIEVTGFKVYQDGMVADGSAALEIIRNGTRQRSKNYEIIGRLLEKGAVLIKTEDLALVKREHAYIIKMTGSRSRKEKEVAAFRYKLAQDKLLKQRDSYIAKRLKETLGEGETGILFIGAYHDVLSKLPEDIEVIQVKDISKVKEYQQTITNWSKDEGNVNQVAEYLVSPVSIT